MNETTDRIVETFQLSQKFDEGVRAAMSRALDTATKEEEAKGDTPAAQDARGYMAVAMVATEVAVSLANIVQAIRRPSEGRTYRAIYDLVIGLNASLYWQKHAPALLPLLHVMLTDHLDSVSLQMERGEVRTSPYDKLIMGAESAPLAMFALILHQVGGPELQMRNAVALKKELMPLLMK